MPNVCFKCWNLRALENVSTFYFAFSMLLCKKKNLKNCNLNKSHRKQELTVQKNKNNKKRQIHKIHKNKKK